MDLVKLKYPIGKYYPPATITQANRLEWIEAIATLPGRLEAALAGWTDEQLDTPYRPEGWTVRQLVHHMADSHLNAHCRIRLALTEDHPTIKAYEQDSWAALVDVKTLPVNHSLDILRGLHARWAWLLGKLNDDELQRSFVHPEYNKTFTVGDMMSLYAWHGDHHLAHITGLKEREGW